MLVLHYIAIQFYFSPTLRYTNSIIFKYFSHIFSSYREECKHMFRDGASSVPPLEAIPWKDWIFKDNRSLIFSCPSRCLGFCFIFKDLLFIFINQLFDPTQGQFCLQGTKHFGASSPATCPSSYVTWWAWGSAWEHFLLFKGKQVQHKAGINPLQSSTLPGVRICTKTWCTQVSSLSRGWKLAP